MKALVFNNKIVDLAETPFPVSDEMTWIDAGSAEIGWEVADGSPVAPQPIPPTEAALEAIRDKKLYAGVTVSGVTVGTDDLTQQRLMAARIIAKEDPSYTVKWKAVGGFVDLNAAQIIAIADAVRAHVKKCFDAEADIEGNAYDTLEDMEAAYDTAYNQA